jgi:PAS domain S-box-containing protein
MSHNNTPLTGVERTFADNEFIVSMTDTKGVITYANDVFLRITGYKETEILGQQHNIIRHPDMPRCVFKFLWDTISSGNEVLAYVINKTKCGDYYWVFAHVTPTYNNQGQIIGYFSSRRSTTKQVILAVEELYKSLREEEMKYASKKDGMQAGLDMLLKILKDKNISYSEFVLSL